MSTTTQIVQENPEIEAYRLGLLGNVQSFLADQIKAGASGLPGYQVAGLSPEEEKALTLAQEGVGSYLPYMESGQGAVEAARNLMTGTAQNALTGAGQYYGQAAQLAAAQRGLPAQYQQAATGMLGASEQEIARQVAQAQQAMGAAPGVSAQTTQQALADLQGGLGGAQTGVNEAIANLQTISPAFAAELAQSAAAARAAAGAGQAQAAAAAQAAQQAAGLSGQQMQAAAQQLGTGVRGAISGLGAGLGAATAGGLSAAQQAAAQQAEAVLRSRGAAAAGGQGLLDVASRARQGIEGISPELAASLGRATTGGLSAAERVALEQSRAAQGARGEAAGARGQILGAAERGLRGCAGRARSSIRSGSPVT